VLTAGEERVVQRVSVLAAHRVRGQPGRACGKDEVPELDSDDHVGGTSAGVVCGEHVAGRRGSAGSVLGNLSGTRSRRRGWRPGQRQRQRSVARCLRQGRGPVDRGPQATQPARCAGAGRSSNVGAHLARSSIALTCSSLTGSAVKVFAVRAGGRAAPGDSGRAEAGRRGRSRTR
jgi:hypothetical protein